METMITNKQASPRQTWVLFRITGIDYRNANLTYKQADKLIKEYNAKNGYQKPLKTSKNEQKTHTSKMTLEAEFIKYITDNMYKVVEACNDEKQIKSVVKNDTKYMKDNGKRYAFFGGGCGIVWLKYDKRCKLAKEIDELDNKHYLKTFTSIFESHFSKDVVKYHDSVGFPIGAMFQQSLQTKLAYYDIVRSFMLLKGVKKVSIEYRYD
jgi:hypothetical protein